MTGKVGADYILRWHISLKNFKFDDLNRSQLMVDTSMVNPLCAIIGVITETCERNGG
jgi:hypothetical protein